MLNVNELVEGVTKVRILNLPRGVEQVLGDVGVFEGNDGDIELPLEVKFEREDWWFNPEDLEIVKDESISSVDVSNEGVSNESPSEDLIIYKSRWDEIIENLEGGYGMTDEESEIVKSVLKNNLPFNVVEDPIIVDLVISKEEQTHLDATHIGGEGNAGFYYNSKDLDELFWWSVFDCEWQMCTFKLKEVSDIYPITISK